MNKESNSRTPGELCFDNCYLYSDLVAIRPLSISDQESVEAIGKDDEIQKWFPLPFPYISEHAKVFIEDQAARAQSSGTGLVSVIEHAGKFAGLIDIKRTDWRSRSCEIGYMTLPWARSKGVTSKALELLSHWIIQEFGFQRIEVRVATGNIASQRVAEKAGYVREGIARNAGFTNLGRLDLVIFSLIPSDLRTS